MNKTFTLIVGDAVAYDDMMTFTRIAYVREFPTAEQAIMAGEQALQDGFDSWCIRELFDGQLILPQQTAQEAA